MFPCNECAKLLIQAGIKEVVFYEVGVMSPLTHDLLYNSFTGKMYREDLHTCMTPVAFDT